MKGKKAATFYAILAAALYALNAPVSKFLLREVSPSMMAVLLYLGAGLGLGIWSLAGSRDEQTPMTRRDFPYVVGMVVLDIAAPIALMLGLERTGAANASLLNNFEIVATSAIAFFLFREAVSPRLAVAIGLVTVASILLSFEGAGSFHFNGGSLLVLAAACCWGLENNCTRMLSGYSSVRITTIKGIFSGIGSFLVAILAGEPFPQWKWVFPVMALGFVAYGLSINFYIKAQKDLGAARTSAYYSVAPFLGVLFGMVFLGERPGWQFYGGLAIMAAATVLLSGEGVILRHTHSHVHTHSHPHMHGLRIHSHLHTHTHSHAHSHDTEEAVDSHRHGFFAGHRHSHGGKG